MATVSGYVGSSGNFTDFTNPVSLHMTMPANYYPDGTISFSDIMQGGAYWHNNHYSLQQTMNLYLCDSAGNNRVKIATITLMPQASQPTPNSGTVSGASALAGKALYLIGTGNPDFINLKNRTTVSVGTKAAAHSITIASASHGSATASTYSAVAGTTITLTASPATGYQLSGYTSSPTVTITNGKFTMPDSDITITPSFSKKTYTITKKNSPSAGGSITCNSSAQYQSSVTATAAADTSNGYYFNGWTTSPSGLISSATSNPATFTMPASNVTLTANYLKRSMATVNKKGLSGGGTVVLTVDPEKSSYTHEYTLSFSGYAGLTLSGTMAAGVTSKTISIPANWSSFIPGNVKSVSGGQLVVTTKNGNTSIGTYTITGFSYTVPSTAVPSLTDPQATLVMDDAEKYSQVSTTLYIQKHAKVNVQATGSGQYNASITKIEVSLDGYSGAAYNYSTEGNVNPQTLNFESGILTLSGTQKITVTATDSRGYTTTKSVTITVTKYSKPSGTLEVWRVNEARDRDEMGERGRFSLTRKWSNIGNNALTMQMKVPSVALTTITATSGDILPSNRRTFNQQNEYTIKLTLADKLESTTITAKLSSARFIMGVNADGDKVGFMKFPNKTYNAEAGQDSTFEFSGETQIWYGDSTLENYLLEDQWEAVTSPVTWDATNVTASGSNATMYKLGKLRILRLSIEVAQALSGWSELGTIASGHRPIENISMMMNNLGSTIDIRVIQFRSNGIIRCAGAAASTSDTTKYNAYVVYRIP